MVTEKNGRRHRYADDGKYGKYAGPVRGYAKGRTVWANGYTFDTRSRTSYARSTPDYKLR